MKRILTMLTACMGMLGVLNSCNGLKPDEQQLFDAIEVGDTKTAEQLINQGTNIEASTLHADFHEIHNASKKGKIAARNLNWRRGAAPLCWAAINGQASAAELLIKRGANVNKANSPDQTPLMFSAINSNEALMRMLLQHGAKVNVQDKYGYTAMHYCAKYCKDVRLMALLHQYGANVDIKSKELVTPLMMAANYNNFGAAVWLIHHNANLRAKNFEGFNATDFARDHNAPEIRNILVYSGAPNTAPKQRNAMGYITSSGSSRGSSGGTCSSCNGVGTYQHSDGSCHPCSSCGGSGRSN